MTAKQRKSVEKALETMRDGVATLYLNGGDPGIGDTGAARLAGLLPDSELISMSLIDNEIGDIGAMRLAKALPQSGLTSLDLSLNCMG